MNEVDDFKTKIANATYLLQKANKMLTDLIMDQKDEEVIAYFQVSLNHEEEVKDFFENPRHYDFNCIKFKRLNPKIIKI